ncbi:hypothetical protein RUND412_011063, partial [Rhizina undulata]
FRRKPKFYLLGHINYWVERFGPPQNSHTETKEHLNSVVWDRLQHSNRQAPSIDTARKFATTEGVTFMARGGVWRHPELEMMTTAGSSFIKIFEQSELWREMAGFNGADGNFNTNLHNPGKRLKKQVSVVDIDNLNNQMLLDTMGLLAVDIWDSGRIFDQSIVTNRQSFVQDSQDSVFHVLHIYRGTFTPKDASETFLSVEEYR